VANCGENVSRQYDEAVPEPPPDTSAPQSGSSRRARETSPPVAGDLASGRRPSGAADQVASIIRAAETTAELMRADAEERVRDRIAEGDRAASYRIRAAEEEAQEIIGAARAEAERLLNQARERDEQARAAAASEGLAIIARAQESAAEAVTEAAQAAARSRLEAETYSRELLGEARSIAGEVRGEGLELVNHLRQMDDSLRANAERLLRDVQSVHSQMMARIERVEAHQRQVTGRPAERPAERRTGGRPDPGTGSAADGDFDVPEFIPRR
jgi:hypothetical protein